MSYVNVVGRRNKSIYIEVQTDSHIAVRSLDSERPDYYDEVPQYGHSVVLPPDSMGYFTTSTANPGVSIISLYS
jgi:hypothetical protein